MKSINSRYGGLTANSISDEGTVVGTPIYITPSQEKKKELINAFRRIKTEQLIEAGWSDTSISSTGIKVVDSTAAPLTPIEMAAGFAEAELRMHLFSRQGLAERTIIKLQALTGVEVVSKEQLIESFNNWIEYVFDDQATPPGSKPRKKAPSMRKTAATV
jgi:hypothetical protein